MKTRDEIIDGILAAFHTEAIQEDVQSQDDLDYEAIVRSTVAGKLKSLRPKEIVRTCDDFGHLGIECCDCCHTGYPHYELDLIDLECGGQAWICCALDRVLNAQRHQKLVESDEYRELEKLF